MTSAYWTALLLLIPLIGGCYAWWKFHTIVLWEWAASVGTAIALCVATFAVANAIATSDTEIHSGYVESAGHIPKWEAEWEEEETYTDSEGKEHTRTVTKSETHYPKWWVETTIGKFDVEEAVFEEMKSRFGFWKEHGSRPDYDSGDRYDYFSNVENPDVTKPVYPIHTTKRWANPFLGTNTIKLGKEVSEQEARQLGLFEYPENNDLFVSGRVMGGCNIPTYRWDQLCAELGATYKVNLTILNFGDRSIDAAVKQRNYWKNGRKNDLVICYGNGWAYVFGWSKSDLIKQELQTLLLENPIDETIVPKIADTVKREFLPYEWHKEEEISRPVPTGAVVSAFFVMLISQAGLAYAFHNNKQEKGYAQPWTRRYR